jgi:hypothetical protein
MLNSELAREKMWSRIHLIPLLTAEEDRDLVRRHYADLAREKELMGSNTAVYNSDRYVSLANSFVLIANISVPSDLFGQHTLLLHRRFRSKSKHVWERRRTCYVHISVNHFNSSFRQSYKIPVNPAFKHTNLI